MGEDHRSNNQRSMNGKKLTRKTLGGLIEEELDLLDIALSKGREELTRHYIGALERFYKLGQGTRSEYMKSKLGGKEY